VDGLALGVAHFRAVSDDDYARVVIAEAFARSPKLDPSGTSWLPLPFWLNGGAMMIFGRSLDVARGVAFALGFVASLLIYFGAKRVTLDPARAAWAAVIATATPWSLYLGVATVPELLTAALSFYAVATLVDRDDANLKARALGAAAIAVAALSRYEAWPIALGFAAFSAIDAIRASGKARVSFVASAAGALVAPFAWLLWNRHAHGDALHFVARVTAFSRASAIDARGHGWEYLLALLVDRPSLTLATLIVFGWAISRRKEVGDELRRWARPAVVIGVALALLTIAGLGDAAPTHHPERVTLLATLVATTAAGAVALRMLGKLSDDKAAAAGLALLGLAATAFFGANGFVDRSGEEAAGAAAREIAAPGEPAFVEIVDYGFLAAVASFGRPEDAVTERSIDPREEAQASSFADPTALAAALERVKPRVVVARMDSAAPTVLGAPLSVHGAWGVFPLTSP
jgi:4-amino-4-deoxy-L-arabinose transferase-like glycosyltransferase